MSDPGPGTPSPPAGRRIFLVGYYGVDNLGDEAIRHAIEAAAASLGVEVARFASRGRSTDPRAVPTGLRAIPATIRAIRATDRVVLGGGGILKDEGLRLPVELLVTAVLARLARRRVDLLAVGVGPFYRPVGRWLVAAIARLCRVRTVRDEASAIALRGLGVGRVLVGADPIFAGDGPAPVVPTGSDRVSGRSRRAAVSVRPWFDRHPPAGGGADPVARLQADLATGLGPLRRAGWAIDFLALYWPRDRDAGRAVAARLPDGSGEVVEAAAALDWASLGTAIAASDLVIAMRYHAVAAAALAGRPVIAIAYEPKVASLAADLAIPAVAVDDPALAANLGSVVAAAVEGRTLPVADPDAVAALRERAWTALRAVLLG